MAKMDRDAYPRCETCKHWQRHVGEEFRYQEDPDVGSCLIRSVGEVNLALIQTDDPYVGIETHKTFGCVCHEAAGGR